MVEDSFGHVEAEEGTSPVELRIESPGNRVLVAVRLVGTVDPEGGSSTDMAAVAGTEAGNVVADEEPA
jgi:hypothetical protein